MTLVCIYCHSSERVIEQDGRAYCPFCDVSSPLEEARFSQESEPYPNPSDRDDLRLEDDYGP